MRVFKVAKRSQTRLLAAAAATVPGGLMLQLLSLGAPARDMAGPVEASTLLPLACEKAHFTPSLWLERWKRQHAGKATFLPASQPGLLPRPRVPRLVMQMARNATVALQQYSAWMATWSQLNPEYDYVLLDDAECADFIDRFCSDNERLGYASLLTGASRSDLFRLFWLRELGGVYADLDAQLTLPLREMLPPNASMLSAANFEPDFMAYEPRHPFLDAALAYGLRNVHEETRKLRDGATPRCKNSHECVIRVTGPIMYWSSLAEAAPAWGCTTNRAGGERPSQRTCAHSPLEPLRHLHVCQGLWPYCGGVYHWDCRNSPKQRDCGKHHYSHVKDFFNASARLRPRLRPFCT